MTVTASSRILILGGARSGKSRHAEQRAEALPGALVYIATGQALDQEMAERIARHRAERGPRWRTVEAPLELPDMLAQQAGAGRVVLVDCLTLRISNLMQPDRVPEAEGERLAQALIACPGPAILVANEVGLGIVPENALARRVRDAAGRINRRIAEVADEVQFIAAGLPITLKPGTPTGP